MIIAIANQKGGDGEDHHRREFCGGSLASSSRPRRFQILFVAPARIGLAKLESRLLGELDAHFRLKEIDKSGE